jgi:hypothetical protein
LNLASGVSSLLGIWVRSYDAPIKFECFIHVLRRVMRGISRRVLLACVSIVLFIMSNPPVSQRTCGRYRLGASTHPTRTLAF